MVISYECWKRHVDHCRMYDTIINVQPNITYINKRILPTKYRPIYSKVHNYVSSEIIIIISF